MLIYYDAFIFDNTEDFSLAERHLVSRLVLKLILKLWIEDVYNSGLIHLWKIKTILGGKISPMKSSKIYHANITWSIYTWGYRRGFFFSIESNILIISIRLNKLKPHTY